MFEFLFSKKIKSLSFFDWSQRVSVLLEEAKKEVHMSALEDTDANYLNQFRKSSQSLVAAAGGIRIGVDLGGIYTMIHDLDKSDKLYILEFTRDLRVAGLPLAQEYTRVSVSRHISRLVSASYEHLLRKLSSRIVRLNNEIWTASSGAKYLKAMIEKTSKSSGDLQEAPVSDGSVWEESAAYRFPLNDRPKPKKKKKPAAKAKPEAKATKN
jgi:hypothetical protein